jgi:hypothetical protein
MTVAAIADTINRHVVKLIAEHLDLTGKEMPAYLSPGIRWHNSAMAEVLMGTSTDLDGDRAWLVGFLAARTPGVDFDGHPADCDWDNLFGHFRAEIQARRDPETPPVRAAEIPVRDGVGSQ